jgi:hypothetical protein
MEVLYGAIAAFCLYLTFDTFSLYWRRFRQGEKIIPDSTERQTCFLALALIGFSVVLICSAFGRFHLF